ncbi:hypothetical protein NDU88_001355 [Pleurodeles waltl]|uniref:Uncharacterized protein n=1 Tax=Pleurodeles waltl TaxID=8319 RepID=A0AAV7TJV3_PLEWA|nr:hypothetical protein NDU88_001355 [Pleurodeles waltl]
MEYLFTSYIKVPVATFKYEYVRAMKQIRDHKAVPFSPYVTGAPGECQRESPIEMNGAAPPATPTPRRPRGHVGHAAGWSSEERNTNGERRRARPEPRAEIELRLTSPPCMPQTIGEKNTPSPSLHKIENNGAPCRGGDVTANGAQGLLFPMCSVAAGPWKHPRALGDVTDRQRGAKGPTAEACRGPPWPPTSYKGGGGQWREEGEKTEGKRTQAPQESYCASRQKTPLAPSLPRLLYTRWGRGSRAQKAELGGHPPKGPIVRIEADLRRHGIP